MVREVAASGSGSGLIAWPTVPCPVNVFPSRAWRSGQPTSGTWSEIALAAGLQLPVFLFWAGSGPAPLPGWAGFSWAPVTTGPLAGAWQLEVNDRGRVEMELTDDPARDAVRLLGCSVESIAPVWGTSRATRVMFHNGPHQDVDIPHRIVEAAAIRLGWFEALTGHGAWMNPTFTPPPWQDLEQRRRALEAGEQMELENLREQFAAVREPTPAYITADPLITEGRKAAHCARRLIDADATAQDLDDMTQAAAAAYWQHQQDGRDPAWCFVCARTAAINCYLRSVLGRNPRHPFSLDAPTRDGGDLPHEWIPAPPPQDHAEETYWLSDESLHGVLYQARAAPGYSKRNLARYYARIEADARIVRLAAAGHTNAGIAQLVGSSEGTIRNRRQRIRRLLETLLPDDHQVEYNRQGGDPLRAREIQLTYPNHRKEIQKWNVC
jgi:DNA-directed RNA polymerase specialized sigma24 family protein